MRQVSKFACAAVVSLPLISAGVYCATGSTECKTGGGLDDELSSIESATNDELGTNLQATSLLQVGFQLGGTRNGDSISAADQQGRQSTATWEGKDFELHFAEGLDQSQFGQSSILHKVFFADLPIKRGTVLELGAAGGINGSNSYAFEYGLGWRTILIEANPDSARALKQNRPGAEVHAPIAISSSSGHVNFSMCENPDVSGIGIPDGKLVYVDLVGEAVRCNLLQIVQVPSEPLSAFLKDTPELDILFLDVEGAELMVLETIDFSKTKIRVASVENGCPGSAAGTFLESKGFVCQGNMGPDFVWTDAAISKSDQDRKHH